MHRGIWIILLALAFVRCRTDSVEWRQSTYLPLITGQWRIMDFLDDSLWISDSDGTVILRSRQNLYRFSADSFLVISDTMIYVSQTIGHLTLGTRTTRTYVTLGQLARAMNDSTGDAILLNHGKLRFIDSFSNATSPPVEVDISNQFITASFLAGTLTLRVTNRFKIPLETVVLEVRNRHLGTLVLRDSIPWLDTGQTHIAQFNMAGKTIEGILTAQMVRVSSPGTPIYPVIIDTNDALEFEVTAQGMRVDSATARFPEQYLVNDTLDVIYQLDPREIEEVHYRTGQLIVGLEHSFPMNMHLAYEFPFLRRNGVPLSVQVDVPASIDGSAQKDSVVVDLAGYINNLRGQHQNAFNAVYVIRRLRMDSTPQIVTLTANDSVHVFSILRGQQLAFVQGYLGRDTAQFYHSVNVSDPTNGMHWAAVAMRWYFDNTLGFDMQIRIDSVAAIHTMPFQQKYLQSSQIQTDFHIPAGTPANPAHRTIELNNANSNITELINFHPDQWRVVGRGIFNAAAQPGIRNQTASDDSYLDIGLEYELPLRLRIDNFRWIDTLPLSPFETDPDVELRIRWKVVNDYPVQLQMQAYWWDSVTGHVFDSLFTEGVAIIAAAQPTDSVDGPMGRIFLPSESKGIVSLPPDRLQQLRDATHWIVLFQAWTQPIHKHVVIYDDYHLKLTAYAEIIRYLKTK